MIDLDLCVICAFTVVCEMSIILQQLYMGVFEVCVFEHMIRHCAVINTPPDERDKSMAMLKLAYNRMCDKWLEAAVTADIIR